MLHKYFSYSFALRFHVPSLNKPCIIQYLVVCMCVFKKDWGRERRECLPIFVHLCVFCKQPLKHKWMALPQSAAVDSTVILFSFKKIPPTKKPKTKLVALKCPNARSFSKLMCCTQTLLLSALLQHCQTSGTLKALKVFGSITLLLDQHKTTSLTACVL